MNWFIIWSPEGRAIAKVEAKDAAAAKRLTPAPYRKHLGEVYVIEDVCTCKGNRDLWGLCDACLAGRAL